MRIEEKCANLEVDLRGKMFEVLDTMLEKTYRVSLTAHLCLPLASDELWIIIRKKISLKLPVFYVLMDLHN